MFWIRAKISTETFLQSANNIEMEELRWINIVSCFPFNYSHKNNVLEIIEFLNNLFSFIK